MVTKGLSDKEVLAQVRDLVGKGHIRWQRHATERMAERGYDPRQIKEVLLRGQFNERPTMANIGGPTQYAFRLACRVDRELIRVAASLVPEQHVIVITVIDP